MKFIPSMNSILLRIGIALLVLSPAPVAAGDVYFSPDGHVQEQIIRRINLAQSTIDIAVYSFTSGNIAEAVLNAHKRGVKIRVIRDKTQSAGKSDENFALRGAGIPVQIRAGRGRGIMHDKFAIFDGKEIFTGSYNWTNNAEHNNYENALFTKEEKVVEAYEKEFKKLWEMPEHVADSR